MKLILSMSKPWNEIKSRMYSNIDTIMIQLAKIYYYHDFEENVIDWIPSLTRGFTSVPPRSNTKKLPTYDDIYTALWTDCLNKNDGGKLSLSQLHSDAIQITKGYEDVPQIEKTDYEGFERFAEAFVKYLALTVSQTSEFNSDDAERFIHDWNDWPENHLVGQSLTTGMIRNRNSLFSSWSDIRYDFILNHILDNVAYLWRIFYFRYYENGSFVDGWCSMACRGWEKVPKCIENGKRPSADKVFDAIWNMEFD